MPGRVMRARAVAFVAFVAWALAPSPQCFAEPGDVGKFGVVWEGASFPWAERRVENPVMTEDLLKTGVKWAVLTVEWAWNEPFAPDDQPVGSGDFQETVYGPRSAAYHHYGFASLDEVVDGLTKSGVTVALKIRNHPRWAGGQSCDTGASHECGVILNTHKALFKDTLHDFAYWLAKRYAGKVRHWILWNEPNLDQYFSPEPPLALNSPVREYVDLVVSPIREGVEAHIPDAVFVGPEVFTPSDGMESTQYDRNWGYESRWLLNWSRNLVLRYGHLLDVFSLHNYGMTDRDPERAVANVRRYFSELGVSMPIWTTEVNYRNGTDDTTEEELAIYICDHYSRLSWERSFLFCLNDGPFGLHDRKGGALVTKPLLFPAFQKIVEGTYDYRTGDVNDDGRLDAVDLVVVRLAVIGKIKAGTAPCTRPLTADYNASGSLEDGDYTFLSYQILPQ